MSATWGYDAPFMNGGEVRNSGVELSLGWNDQVGGLRYSVNWNGSYNKNEVTKIANMNGIVTGPIDVLATGTSEFYRLQVGRPMGFFYGFVHDGIFQNQAEVEAHSWTNPDTGETRLIQPNAKPGDIRFKDLDNSGTITQEGDKTMIGNGHPKYLMGLTVSLDYKGWDLMVVASARLAFDIAKAYHGFTSGWDGNRLVSAFEQRWTSEGSTNFWPRLQAPGSVSTQNITALYLEKGDYMKIQNLTVGYDLKRLFRQMPLGQLRLYGTVNNLFTFTNYTGMDPEIGGDSMTGSRWVSSIDLGFYPSARTFIVGVSATF
jgi:hypothetical protein